MIQIPSHTHSRGSMNITGQFWLRRVEDSGHNTGGIINLVNGSFYSVDDGNEAPVTPVLLSNTSNMYKILHQRIGFDASRSWTGETIKHKCVIINNERKYIYKVIYDVYNN